MSSIRRITFVAISMLLISCQSDQIEHDPTNIPTPLAELSATLQAADSVDYAAVSPPFAPSGILNVNNRYLVEHQRTSSNFFRVLKLPELTYLYVWGLEGRGPGEFLWPPMYLFTANDEDIILMTDIMDFRQEQYEVSDSTLSLIQSDLFHNKYETISFEVIALLNKHTYVVANLPKEMDDNAEFHLLKTNNDTPIRTFGDYPNTAFDIFNRPLRFLKTSASNSQLERFAIFYKSYNAFKIMDFNGDLLGHYKVDGFDYDHTDTVVRDPYFSRNVAHSTDELIYTNGYDMPLNDFESGNHPSTFEVWNWEGESVYRASFDRQIWGYTVSELHGKIYGFTQQNPEIIYIYDLPTIQQ